MLCQMVLRVASDGRGHEQCNLKAQAALPEPGARGSNAASKLELHTNLCQPYTSMADPRTFGVLKVCAVLPLCMRRSRPSSHLAV